MKNAWSGNLAHSNSDNETRLVSPDRGRRTHPKTMNTANSFFCDMAPQALAARTLADVDEKTRTFVQAPNGDKFHKERYTLVTLVHCSLQHHPPQHSLPL